MAVMHVGIDDTDSPRTGCTTYVASLLVEKLVKIGVSFIDYPNLIRLNPNVPWKTRGNGALCLRFICHKQQVEEIKETAVDVVVDNSDLNHVGTEPGVVFFQGEIVPDELKMFAKQAIQNIVNMKNAMKLIESFKAEAVGFKTGRGIIGALAAVGEDLKSDHTYELIAYRTSQNRGSPRRIDATSVFEMNEKTSPWTFNNVDPESGRVLITPRGPDPILYGIRGETADVVKKANMIIHSFEPIERWTIFRTNHGTDAHLRRVASIVEVRPFEPIIMKGAVSKAPWIVPRRHIIFSICDETGQIDCAAYEPTNNLRKKANLLIAGDIVEVYGGVRQASEKRPLTINLEKLKVIKLAPKLIYQNPICTKCGRRMESIGMNKGLRCRKCGFHSSRTEKLITETNRDLKRKLYVTSPRSQRHLTKPLSRYGLEKSGTPKRMISKWFWVNESLS